MWLLCAIQEGTSSAQPLSCKNIAMPSSTTYSLPEFPSISLSFIIALTSSIKRRILVFSLPAKTIASLNGSNGLEPSGSSLSKGISVTLRPDLPWRLPRWRITLLTSTVTFSSVSPPMTETEEFALTSAQKRLVPLSPKHW